MGSKKVKLTFVYNVELDETQEKIINEIKWHSKYLHSHTLLEIILNYLRDYKS